MNLFKTLGVACGALLVASAAQAGLVTYHFTGGDVKAGHGGTDLASEFSFGESASMTIVVDNEIPDSNPDPLVGEYFGAFVSVAVTIGDYQATGFDGVGFATALSDPLDPKDPSVSLSATKTTGGGAFNGTAIVNGPDVGEFTLGSLGLRLNEPTGSEDLPVSFVPSEPNRFRGFLSFEDELGEVTDVEFSATTFAIEQDFEFIPAIVTNPFGNTQTFNSGTTTIGPPVRYINNGTVINRAQFNAGSELENNGTFQNEGTLDNSFTLENNGVLENTDRFVNSGTITNTGTLINEGRLVLRDDGVILNKSGTIQNTSTGTIKNNRATAAVIGGAIENQGLIDGGAASIILTGDVSGAGDYEGSVAFNGTLNTGDGPALITGESLLFGAGNTLFMEIGGTGRGSEYDAIDALSVTLGGILDIALLDLGSGFSPMAGDVFDLIVADQIMGAFSGFNFAELMEGLFFTTNLIVNEFGDDIFQLVVDGQLVQSSVPGPGALLILLVGLAGLGAARKRAA